MKILFSIEIINEFTSWSERFFVSASRGCLKILLPRWCHWSWCVIMWTLDSVEMYEDDFIIFEGLQLDYIKWYFHNEQVYKLTDSDYICKIFFIFAFDTMNVYTRGALECIFHIFIKII